MFGGPYLVWHEEPDFTALVHATRSDPDAVAGVRPAVGVPRQHKAGQRPARPGNAKAAVVTAS